MVRVGGIYRMNMAEKYCNDIVDDYPDVGLLFKVVGTTLPYISAESLANREIIPFNPEELIPLEDDDG